MTQRFDTHPKWTADAAVNNPGIETPQDYIDLVSRHSKLYRLFPATRQARVATTSQRQERVGPVAARAEAPPTEGDGGGLGLGLLLLVGVAALASKA